MAGIHEPSVSLDKAAERLGVSKRSVYNYIRAGWLRTTRVPNGSRRVVTESLDLALKYETRYQSKFLGWRVRR